MYSHWCLLRTHPIAQLAILFDLDARIAVASQNYGVIALCALLLSIRGMLWAIPASLHAIIAVAGKVLPTTTASLRFQYDSHIVFPCHGQI